MTPNTLDRFKLVKARLLPLTSWEATLERLIERLPRQLVTVEMMPAVDVTVIDDGQGEFRANGPAPRFALQPSPLLERGGWYYLEAALVRNNGNREAALLIETHSGKSITIPIPTNLRGTVREVFFLPPKVRSLYWAPTAAAGYFSQSPLLIHRISPLESLVRRLYRLIPDLWRFGAINSVTVPKLNLWRILVRPHKAYLHTAELRRKRLTGSDYATFLALNARQHKRDVRLLQREMKAWPAPPLVSLIIAAQTPKGKWLSEAISSVQNQLYPHWELVLTGDINAETSDVVAGCNKQKNRIHCLPMPAATEKSALLNSAFAACTGDFVGQLGQHDQLPPESLALLVRKWIMAPDCDLIYSDEDALDDLGLRCRPHFKPDWNPTMFYAHNYLGRLCLYRREGLLAINGYRSGYPEAEDYDLCLRLIRYKPSLLVVHATGVGCHCRPDRTGPQIIVRKGYAHRSGKHALEDFFRGSGTTVADGPELGLYRIHHPLPAPAPLVSIIIPSRDKKNILAGCVESIVHKTRYPNWEMLIVDNQSTETTTLNYLEAVQQDPRIQVLRYDHPFNFSAINNFAVERARGEVVALVNNDVEIITPEWLNEMVSHALQPNTGAVGAKLLYENNTIQHAGVILGIGGVAGHAHKNLAQDAPGYRNRAVVAQNLSAVTGACLVVRKALYQEVGGLNAEDFAVAFNDIDFCLKLAAQGYRNVFTPHAVLYHHESISRGHDDTPEKQAIFNREFRAMKRIWGSTLQKDPAYNPNMSTDFEGFTLKIR